MDFFHSPGPAAFILGPFTVRWYGILIATGIVLCYLYATRAAKKNGLEPRHIENMAFWVILSGAVGARLYYVLFNFSYFWAHPLNSLKIWEGGLAIHGALIGGTAAFFLYVRRHKISWLQYIDVIIPSVLLAQGIGRWGNFFNNEAFGGPTDLPWKLFIPPTARPAGYEADAYFHPTFLYESLWDLIGFALLVYISRRHPRPGTLLFLYMIWYSIGRFFIESLRLDSLYFGPLRTAQIASVLLCITGIIGLIIIGKKHKMKT